MRPEGSRVRRWQRFAALAEHIPQLVWMSHDGGHWTWSSPRWAAYTGQTAEVSQDLGWYEAVHPDDRAATQNAWQEATLCGVFDVRHRLLGADGHHEARWFHTRATPLPASGHRREWLGTSTDVHEITLLEERQRRLLAALRPRVNDILTLVRAVARQTVGTSETLEEYALHLDSRLDAVARAQAMMARDPDGSVDFVHLVADELRAHAAHEGERLQVSGPPFRVWGKAAELLSLTLHELAMNSVKHGALSVPRGRIAVTWRLEKAAAGEVLRFEWLETGVSVPEAPPRRQGFGTKLIEHTLGRELGAEAALSLSSAQVRCTITLPVPTGPALPALPSLE